MILFKEKAEKRSLGRSLKLAIYITLCYYALVGGNEVTRIYAYRRLTSDTTSLDDVVAEGLIERTVVGRSPGLSVSGSLMFYPNWPNISLLIFPGFLISGLAFACIHYLRNATLRGFFLLFMFMVICSVSNGLQKRLLGVGQLPTVGVFVVSGFYGALFWLLDNYTASNFREVLLGINGDKDKMKILYDYTKSCLQVFITLFIGICITFAWKISTGFGQNYREIGLERIMTGYTAWLALWGSIGILGIASAEAARRMWAVVQSVKSSDETIKNRSK